MELCSQANVLLDIEVCKNRFSGDETDSKESVTGRFPAYAYPDLNKQIKCMLDTGADMPVWCGSEGLLKIVFPETEKAEKNFC